MKILNCLNERVSEVVSAGIHGIKCAVNLGRVTSERGISEGTDLVTSIDSPAYNIPNFFLWKQSTELGQHLLPTPTVASVHVPCDSTDCQLCYTPGTLPCEGQTRQVEGQTFYA